MSMARRIDHLMAQRVDVAIVFRDMLGGAEAERYLTENAVPGHIIERVLAGLAVVRVDGGTLVQYLDMDPVTEAADEASMKAPA